MSSNSQQCTDLANKRQQEIGKHWPIFQKLSVEFMTKLVSFMVLDQDGNDLLLLCNDNRMYRFDTREYSLTANSEQPVEIENVTTHNIANLVTIVGLMHVIWLSKSGAIYYYDLVNDSLAERQTRRLTNDENRFVSIQAGDRHYLALTKSGKVFAWNDIRQQTVTENVAIGEPIPVPELESMCVTQIACGMWHSMALTSFGTVYAWGNNQCGQLGFACPTEQIQTKPTLIVVNGGETVKFRQISAGSLHSMFLTEDNRIFICGDNSKSQLTSKVHESIYRYPSEVQIDLSCIESIEAFDNLSVVLWSNSESQNCLYVWGNSKSEPILVTNAKSTFEVIVRHSTNNRSTKNLVKLVPDSNSTTTNSADKESSFGDRTKFILEQFKELYKSDAGKDVWLQFSDHSSISVHSWFLYANSSFYRELLSSNHDYHHFGLHPTMLQIVNFPPAIIRAYIEYLYTGQLECDDSDLFDLFEFATTNSEPELRHHCVEQMFSIIDLDNFFNLYQLATIYKLADCERQLVAFARKNVDLLIDSQNFDKIDREMRDKLIIDCLSAKIANEEED